MNKFILLIFILAFSIELLSAKELSDQEFYRYLQCYHQEEAAKNSEPQAQFEQARNSLADDELYKLFIDKARLENPQGEEQATLPHLIFDVKEPGYWQAMYRTYHSIPDYIGKPFSLDMLLKLHDDAVDGVALKNGLTFAKGISEEAFGYGMPNKSDAALKELIDSGVLYDRMQTTELMGINCTSMQGCENYALDSLLDTMLKKRFMARQTLNLDGLRLETIVHNKQQWEEILAPVLAHFQGAMKKTQTLRGKLSAIAELLRILEVAHILPDGNTRTDVFLVLSKFLIENNIPLAIFNDPNFMCGSLTLEEMVTHIMQGIRNFLNEKPEYHREYLAQNCQNLIMDDAWLYSNDYVPYHQEGKPLQLIIEQFFSSWQNTVTTVIDTNQIDRLFDKHTPLYISIVLGQTDLVVKLLQKGALPFLGTEHYPIRQSLSVFRHEIARTILGHYKEQGLNDDANNDLEEAALYLYKKKERTEEENAILVQIIDLLGDNWLAYFLTQDVDKFTAIISSSPQIIFKKIAQSQTLISFLYQDAKSDPQFLDVAFLALKEIKNFSELEIKILRHLLSNAIKKNDETKVNLILALHNNLAEKSRNYSFLPKALSNWLNASAADGIICQRIIDSLIQNGAHVDQKIKENDLFHNLIDSEFEIRIEDILHDKMMNEAQKSKALNILINNVEQIGDYFVGKNLIFKKPSLSKTLAGIQKRTSKYVATLRENPTTNRQPITEEQEKLFWQRLYALKCFQPCAVQTNE